MATRSVGNLPTINIFSAVVLRGCDAARVRKCVRNGHDELENTYWPIINFAAATLRKRPWKDTMVILALFPCEAATFASHDDGSLFRDEAGDRGLVRPLGNTIMCSVCWIINVGMIWRMRCSGAVYESSSGVKKTSIRKCQGS